MPHLLDATMFWNPSGAGGVRQVIDTKRAHLTGGGWQHSLLAPGARGPGAIDCGGLRLPASGGYRFVVGRAQAAQLIERARPDIVEAADPYTLAWAVLDACRRLKVPAVAFCHSNLPALARHWAGGERGRVAGWAARRAGAYLARLYQGYQLVLAPSRGMTRQLHELGVVQAVHQPLGVDTQVFTPAARDMGWRRWLEKRLGLAPGTQLLVYAGRFAAEKNLGVLVQAVERLGPRHCLLAVGSGPRPPAGPRVRVLPAEGDRLRLARILASADAFVHSGDQETFGLAALEAMACGVPVIVSAHGGLGELADGVGITVPSQRPLDWAAAISACLHDGDSRLPRAALARARSLDWRLVMAQWTVRYRNAMRGQPVAQMVAQPAVEPRHAPQAPAH
jgi:alpha-1,6-mannosyltransferase